MITSQIYGYGRFTSDVCYTKTNTSDHQTNTNYVLEYIPNIIFAFIGLFFGTCAIVKIFITILKAYQKNEGMSSFQNFIF
jgi:hypothetical protein